MNYIDLVLVAILAYSVWEGYKQGFILAALSLISWTGALAIAFLTHGWLKINALGVWALPVAFVMATIIAKSLLQYVTNLILDRVPDSLHDNKINKAAGVIPGCVNGTIWLTLLGSLFTLIPFTHGASVEVRESRLAGKAGMGIAWLEGKIEPVFRAAVNASLPKTNAVISSDEPVKLPFKVAAPTARPDLEREMLTILNAERKKNRLRPLSIDKSIVQVARLHSADMFKQSYFSHYSPDGGNPYNRMRNGNVVFAAMGENIAIAQTIQIAHQGLIDSPTHRANILNPNFGRVGIGIMDGGIYGLMITQNFAD
ncbi:hypothetical protein FPZ43_03320 [Mucilaginibacter pallidiroseus]|uniref:SCP domain-containing protein n=1 Tax=Mucilaginibacter pallidiroseus TaxID=2599295 RepID=A0A563UJQ1_9SPHI|nr:CvpA family protein [Mucilaginibacter pallidiroseus]TWR31516.1 hypothetical protein FPZ43_03320 [Mucilaginibacter pallidiroseus]